MVDPSECSYLCGQYVPKVYKVGDIMLGRVFVCGKCKNEMDKKEEK